MHTPEKKGVQEAYPAGQGFVGVGVLIPVVVDGGPPDTTGDGVTAGLLVGLRTRNTATLRLRIVALDTPASLASQE